MGKEFYDKFDFVKNLFKEADEILNFSLSKLIIEGPKEELDLTTNTQPAIFLISYSIFNIIKKEFNIDLHKAKYFAGHSLGEYSALAIAGAFSIGDAARLLRARGRAMQAAVPVGVGAMAALLGLNLETAREVAEAAAEGEVCQAANDNDPGQVVVSGHKAAVERAVDLAKEKGAKRAVILPVSAPFHCALMAPAADAMQEALAAVKIAAPKVPVIANVRAEAVADPEEIRDLLIAQITGSVRWRESVEWMSANGVSEIWEIGAGKALSGMVRRINRDISCRNIAQPADVSAAVESLN